MTNRRAEFGFVLVSFIYLGCLIFSWLLNGYEISISSSSPVILVFNEENHPLFLWQIPLQIVFLSLALFSINLSNEFFGVASSVIFAVGGGVVMVLFWGILFAVPLLPLSENARVLNPAEWPFFDPGKTAMAFLAPAVVAGFAVTAILFNLARKLTRSHLVFFRIAVASAVGLLFVSAGPALKVFYSVGLPGRSLAVFITAYAQLLACTLILIPFFYFTSIFLGFVVGKEHRDGIKKLFAKKPLFIPKEKDFFESRKDVQEKRI